MQPLQRHGHIGHRGVQRQKVHGSHRPQRLAEQPPGPEQRRPVKAPQPLPHRHGQQHRRALGVAVDQDRYASDGQKGHRDAQKAQEDAGAEPAQGGNQPPHPQQGDQADRYAVAEQAEHQRRAGQKQLRHGGDSPQPRLIGVAVGPHQPCSLFSGFLVMRPRTKPTTPAPMAAWRAKRRDSTSPLAGSRIGSNQGS